MNKALKLIEELIKEHEESGYCTDYKHALCCTIVDPETDFNNAYDVGRYETLTNLYNELKRMEQ